MNTTATSSHLHTVLRTAQAQHIVPPEATLPEERASSWLIVLVSIVGAQLVVWPLMFFLLERIVYNTVPGAWGASALALAVGVYILRGKKRGIVQEQIAFDMLLLGMGLGIWGLKLLLRDIAIHDSLNSLMGLLAALSMAVAWLVRVRWVQVILGTICVLACANIVPESFVFVTSWAGGWRNDVAILIPALWLLAGGWWLWCAREPHWGGRAWMPGAHAFMTGAGIGVLLQALRIGMHHILLGTRGSVDRAFAGMAALFHFNIYTLTSALLSLACGAWLAWRWQKVTGLAPTMRALWVVTYLLWAVLALVEPVVGVLAVMFTVAWGTQRRRMAGLVLCVLLVQLSVFYYALQWPLVHKATLLMALGSALALALLAIHRMGQAATPAQRRPLLPMSKPTVRAISVWRLGLAAGLLLTLFLTQHDAMKKEHVLAEGQKIYIPLAPRDPRSLMQGDYMALRFDVPVNVHEAINQRKDGLPEKVLVVARLDSQGIATILRLYDSTQTLGTGELLIPLKHMHGRWVVVTNAYFFPEGQGRIFNTARYGEFRALGKGQVLLAGLADEHLHRIEPQPDSLMPDKKE